MDVIIIYAKLINNNLSYAPNPIKVGDSYIGNPPDSVYIQQGFLPVIETDPPEAPDGYYMEPYWAERAGQIVQEWEAVELPPEPDDITPDEALDIILGGGET